MSDIDRRFALVDSLSGDVIYPYMTSQRSTKRYGYALTQPGEKDRGGKGHYTTDINEVVQRVVIDGWKVRARTVDQNGRRRSGSMGIGKTANLNYWVSPELHYLVSAAPTQPIATLPNIINCSESVGPVPEILAPDTARKSSKQLDQSEKPLDEDIDSATKVKYPLEDIQQRAIRTRRGQPDFRRRIFVAYGHKCAVTGCAVHSVLEAAHIIPHAEGTDWDVGNGLPLRADIHTLFDLRLLAVGQDYRIHVSSRLAGSDYETLHGQMIQLPEREIDYPSPEKLAKHFEGFKERESEE
jgi:hypothetical protein